MVVFHSYVSLPEGKWYALISLGNEYCDYCSIYIPKLLKMKLLKLLVLGETYFLQGHGHWLIDSSLHIFEPERHLENPAEIFQCSGVSSPYRHKSPTMVDMGTGQTWVRFPANDAWLNLCFSISSSIPNSWKRPKKI